MITSRVTNVSVPIGRDATFTCNVKNLQPFKVRIVVHFLNFSKNAREVQ